ncbi:unnamed protein product [Larinioides sclopetarius]|uniref:Uncharacterized protein n=1 Tax=Larinioides sclopetarius TaxID=280406 RepID=A0AAV2A633_9ARAC
MNGKVPFKDIKKYEILIFKNLVLFEIFFRILGDFLTDILYLSINELIYPPLVYLLRKNYIFETEILFHLFTCWFLEILV